MSLLDFPYFAKISCFFSACKYSAICKKIKKLIKNRPKSPPGNFAAANLIIKSDKTIFQWKKLIITAMMPVMFIPCICPGMMQRAHSLSGWSIRTRKRYPAGKLLGEDFSQTECGLCREQGCHRGNPHLFCQDQDESVHPFLPVGYLILQ